MDVRLQACLHFQKRRFEKCKNFILFIRKKFGVTGIPSLVVVNKEGDLVSKMGRSEVQERGPQVFQQWIASSK